jgi:hypothetical protein
MCSERGFKPSYKKKLWINTDNNKAHCFRCAYGTNHAREVVERRGIKLPPGVRWGVLTTLEAAERPDIELPAGFTTDWREPIGGEEAFAYLHQTRKLGRATIAGYGIGYCPVGRYASRVVVPIYMGGQLVWWQARDITGNQEPKYLSPSGSKKAVLFNLDRAKKSGCLLLCEGPFDTLAVPAYGVSTLGKTLSDEQRGAILRAKPAAVLVAYDADDAGQMASIKVVSQLTGFVPIVRRLPMPAGCKDLGDTNPAQQATIALFCNAIAKIGAGA